MATTHKTNWHSGKIDTNAMVKQQKTPYMGMDATKSLSELLKPASKVQVKPIRNKNIPTNKYA